MAPTDVATTVPAKPYHPAFKYGHDENEEVENFIDITEEVGTAEEPSSSSTRVVPPSLTVKPMSVIMKKVSSTTTTTTKTSSTATPTTMNKPDKKGPKPKPTAAATITTTPPQAPVQHIASSPSITTTTKDMPKDQEVKMVEVKEKAKPSATTTTSTVIEPKPTATTTTDQEEKEKVKASVASDPLPDITTTTTTTTTDKHKAIKHGCDQHPGKELEPVCAHCTYTTHRVCVKAFLLQDVTDGQVDDTNSVSPFMAIDEAAAELLAEAAAHTAADNTKGRALTQVADKVQSQRKALELQMADLSRQIQDDHERIIKEAARRSQELIDALTISAQAKIRALEEQEASLMAQAKVLAGRHEAVKAVAKEEPIKVVRSCLAVLEEQQQQQQQGGNTIDPTTFILPKHPERRLYLPPSEQLVDQLRTRGWAGVVETKSRHWSLQGPAVISYPSKARCVMALESSIEGDKIPYDGLVTARARAVMVQDVTVPVTITSKDDGKVYEISFEATEDLVGRYVEVEAAIADKAVGGGPRKVAVVNNILGSMVFFNPDHRPGFLALMRFVPGKTWRLLYRASRDGWSASDFHSRCDKKGATVILAKTSGDNPSIFGGYTSESWESTPKATYKKDPTAFLFSLVNTADMDPVKMEMKSRGEGKAIVCEASYGPAFGKACDLFLGDNPNVSSHMNRALLGSTYEVPKGVKDASTFLAGSEEFTLEEMEVYEVL